MRSSETAVFARGSVVRQTARDGRGAPRRRRVALAVAALALVVGVAGPAGGASAAPPPPDPAAAATADRGGPAGALTITAGIRPSPDGAPRPGTRLAAEVRVSSAATDLPADLVLSLQVVDATLVDGSLAVDGTPVTAGVGATGAAGAAGSLVAVRLAGSSLRASSADPLRSVLVTAMLAAGPAGTTPRLQARIVAGASADPGTGPTAPAATASAAAGPVLATADQAVSVEPLGPAVAGAAAGWRVRVLNRGPDGTAGRVLSVLLGPGQRPGALPAGCTAAPAGGPGGGGIAVTCRRGDLAPGGADSVDVPVTLEPGVAEGATVWAGAVAASDTWDPVAADDGAGATARVATRADLGVEVGGAPTLLEGTRFAAPVTVTNAGPSNATRAWVEVAPLAGAPVPPGGFVVAVGGRPCPGARCDLGTLGPGARSTLEVSAAALPGAGGTVGAEADRRYAFRVRAGSATPDPDPVDSALDVVRRVVQPARLRATLTSTPALAGEWVHWTAVVTNDGPGDLAEVTVRAVATGIEQVVFAATAVGACAVDGPWMTCPVGALGTGSSVVLWFTTMTPAAASAVASAAAVDAWGSSAGGVAAAPARAELTVPVGLRTDLRVASALQVDPSAPGAPARWTVKAANDGPSTARPLTIVHVLPPSLAVTAVSPSAGGTCAVDEGPPRAVRCAWAEVPARQVREVGVEAVPLAGADPPAAEAVGGDAAFDGATTVTAGNTGASATAAATDSTVDVDIPPVHRSAQSSAATLDVTAGARASGDGAVVDVTATNRGPGAAAEVVVALRLPPGLAVAAGTPCTGRTLLAVCSLGPLAAGASVDTSIPLVGDGGVPAATAPGVVQVWMSGPTFTPPVSTTLPAPALPAGPALPAAPTPTVPAPTGPAPSVPVPTLPAPAPVPAPAVPAPVPAVAAGVVNPSQTRPGDAVTFAIVAGPGLGADGTSGGPVTVSAPVPTGLVGVTAAADGISCRVDATRITCPATATSTASAGPRVVVVRGVVDPRPAEPGAPGTAEMRATIGSAPGAVVVASTAVDRSAAPVLAGTVSPVPVVAGGNARWLLSWANQGRSAAASPVLTVDLPADVVAASVRAAMVGGSCSVYEQRVTCRAAGPLAAGATSAAVVEARTRSGATPGPGRLVASASVSSPSPVAGPAAAVLVADLVARSDLRAAIEPPGPFVAGTTAAWTVLVVNDGPSDATGVRLVVGIVPPSAESGTTAAPAAPAPGAVSVSGADCTGDTCRLGTLLAGEARAVRVTAALPADLPPGRVSLVATVAGDGPEIDPADDTATVAATVNALADLGVTKRALADPVVAGAAAAYEVVVTNDGPSVARGVMVVDPYPPALAPARPLPTGCTATADTIRCSVGDLAPGTTAVRTLVFTSDSDLPAGDQILNPATVSSDTPDPVPGSDRATAAVTTVTRADLAVRVAGVAGGAATPGAPIEHLITVENAGPSTARAVSLAVDLPAAVSAVSITWADGSADGRDPVVCAPLPQPSCDLGDLASGGSVAVLVAGRVDPAALGELRVAAVVSSSTADPDAADNAASVGSPLVPAVTLAATIEGAGPVVPGRTTTPVVRVRNLGPSTARDVALGFVLPDGVTVERVASEVGACEHDGGRLAGCVLGLLPPSADPRGGVSVTLAAAVAPDATGSFTLDARLDDGHGVAGTPDDVLHPAEAVTRQLVVPYRPLADLAVRMTAATVEPRPGAPVSFAVELVNRGPTVARSVSLDGVLPGQLTDLRIGGFGATCADTGSAGAVTCRWASTLGVGSTRYLVARGRVADPVGPAGIDPAAVRVIAPAADPDPSDNASAADADALASADIGVTIRPAAASTAAPPDRAAVDVLATRTDALYDLVVTNRGPRPARSVVVDLSAASGATAGLVDGDDPTCARECPLDTLGVGSTATRRLVVRADEPLPAGTPLVTAAVSSSTVDGAVSDNRFVLAPRVVELAELSVDMAAAGPATPGRSVRFDLTVANDGPSVAREVVLSDVLPPGTSLRSASPPGRCADENGLVLCRLGDLAVGARERLALTLDIDPQALPGTLVEHRVQASSISAAAFGSGAGGPAEATVEVVVGGVPRLVLSASPRAPGADPGGPVGWRLSVRNTGTAVARDLALRAEVPPAVLLDAVGPAFGSCAAAGGPADGGPAAGGPTSGGPEAVTAVVCTLAELAPGATWSVELDGLLARTTVPGLLALDAVVEAAADVDLAVPAVSSTVTVGRLADLSVEIERPDRIVAGTDDRMVVRVRNDGPADAEAVRVELAITGADLAGVAGADACDPGGCDLGTLPAGSERDLEVRVAVPSAAFDPVTVRAEARGAGATDPDGATVERLVLVAAEHELSPRVDVPGPVVAGTTIDVGITLENRGPSDARSVVAIVSASTPTLTLTPAPGAPECSAAASGGLRCELGVVRGGGTVALPVRIGASAAAAPRAAALLVTVSADGDDTDPANDGVSPVLSLVRRSAFAMTATPDDAAPLVAGLTGALTLSIANQGPSDAPAGVLNLALPAGVALDPAAVATCAAAGTDLRCPVPATSAGAATTLSLRLALDAALEPGRLRVDTGLSAPAADPRDTTLTVATPLEVEVRRTVRLRLTAPDRVATTDDAATAPAFQATVTVGNDGPSATGPLRLLPLGGAAGGATAAVSVDGAGTCDRLPCLLPPLLPGAAASATVVVRLAADVPFGSLAGVVAVEDTSGPGDGGVARRPVTVEVARRPQLVAEVAGPTEITAGTAARWRLTITPVGALGIDDASLRLDPPPGVALGRVTAAGRVLDEVGCAAGCGIGAIASGGTVEIEVAGRADPRARGSVALDGELRSRDGAVVGRVASQPVAVVAGTAAELSVESAPGAAPGQHISWQVTTRNRGASEITGAALEVDVPGGLADVSLTSTAGPCAARRCPLGPLAPGERQAVVVSGVLRAGADPETAPVLAARLVGEDGLVVSRTVGVPGSPPGVSPGPVRAAVAAPGALQVTAPPSPAVAGSWVDWLVAVPSLPQATSLVVQLDAALGDDVRLTVPDGVRCAVRAAAVRCEPFAGGALNPSGHLVVSTRVAGGFTGSAVGVAAVLEGPVGAVPGAAGAGAVGSLAGPVSAAVDTVASSSLHVDTTPGATAGVGEPVAVDVTVVNDGPSAARDAQVVVGVPPILASVRVVTPWGVCALVDDEARCPLPAVAAGERVTVHLTGIAAGSGTGRGTATIVLPGGGRSPEATFRLDVRRTAAVRVSTRALRATVESGGLVPFTVTVTNDGPDPSGPLQVDVPLPAGATVSGAQVATGLFDPETRRWALDDLGAGDEAVLGLWLDLRGQGSSGPRPGDTPTLVPGWTPARWAVTGLVLACAALLSAVPLVRRRRLRRAA